MAFMDWIGFPVVSSISNSTALLLTGFVILVVWLFFFKEDKLSNIPGPSGLPIIGNLHQLDTKIHESFTNLSRQYGDVYRIKLGSRPAVVLNGRNAIKQALIVQTIEFGGRMEDLAINRAFNSARGGTIGGSTYGKRWNFLHDFLVRALHDFTDGSQQGVLEKGVSDEALKFIEFVLTKQASPVFDAFVLLNHSTVNLFTRFLFGSGRELDDPFMKEFLDLHEEYFHAWSGISSLNALPWLEYILPAKRRNVQALCTRQADILKTYADKRNREYVEGSREDLLSYIRTENAYLNREALDEVGLTDEKLRGLVFEFFGGGHGSMSSSVYWPFVYAIAFPELQKEIQEEIDRVVGRGRTPTFADREKLPLTQAFLAEIYRHASAAPLTAPHCTTKDTILGGGFNYAIPEGTMVFVNLHSTFQDPEEWDNPGQFNPRRFLGEDGKTLDRDKIDSLMRFGGGIRLCTGWKVGILQIFLFFATVMHQCSVKNVAGQKLSLEGVLFPLGLRPPKTKMELVRR